MPKENKKNIILRTAKQLFSEKGFDATGMEEIAVNSRIPKSLIYYHFKNKEDLLNTIMDEFVNAYHEILHCKTHGINKISGYIVFLKQNKECVKIMLGESLKSGENQTLIIKTLTPLMDIEREQTDSRNENHLHWLTEFFTSIVPAMLMVCYEDSWCESFGVTSKQMEQDFFEAYKLTHGAYHHYIQKESL